MVVMSQHGLRRGCLERETMVKHLQRRCGRSWPPRLRMTRRFRLGRGSAGAGDAARAGAQSPVEEGSPTKPGIGGWDVLIGLCAFSLRQQEFSCSDTAELAQRYRRATRACSNSSRLISPRA
jgi:hypothetical protein